MDDEKSTNNMIIEEYTNFINSKSYVNSFSIFKCGKEAFILNNLKINSGFFISISFLLIQLILFVYYVIFYINSKSNEAKNVIKSNPPKITKFEIEDDFEEKEKKLENEQKLSEDKKSIEKENEIKSKPISFENEKNKKERNIQNFENNFLNLQVNSTTTKNTNNNIIQTKKETENDNGIIDMKINEQNKVNIIKTEKNNLIIDEEKEKKKIKLNEIQKENHKKRSLKNLNSSKDSFISHAINKKKDDQIINNSFLDYYWKILSLKQPIINIFSPLKSLKIENSYIPTIVKLMRIVFILSLNIFFNILHLEQKYFRKKYEYFNKKYNIIYTILSKKISLSERYSFAFGNAILPGFISFFICFIIQSVLNYFFFNIKKKLSQIKVNECNLDKKKTNNNDNINNKEDKDSSINESLYIIMEKENKKFLIFFGIGFLVIIIICYSVITFNEVYRGGIIDLIAGTFWAFIFLQIIPFIYCLILAILKYFYGINSLYQSIYF